MKKQFTKEQNELIYKKMDLELDTLSNSETKLIYANGGSRRVLVDKNEGEIHGLRVRPRKGYIEVSVRYDVNGVTNQTNLSRVILNVTDKLIQVDHINRNTLDNRRCNLRELSPKNNALNKTRWNFNNKFKGVYKKNNFITIEVQSFYCAHRLNLPSSTTEEEAAFIYDCIALKLNGDIHETNFDKSNYNVDVINSTYNKWQNVIRIHNRKKVYPLNVMSELNKAKMIFESLYTGNHITEIDYSKLVNHLNILIK